MSTKPRPDNSNLWSTINRGFLGSPSVSDCTYTVVRCRWAGVARWHSPGPARVISQVASYIKGLPATLVEHGWGIGTVHQRRIQFQVGHGWATMARWPDQSKQKSWRSTIHECTQRSFKMQFALNLISSKAWGVPQPLCWACRGSIASDDAIRELIFIWRRWSQIDRRHTMWIPGANHLHPRSVALPRMCFTILRKAVLCHITRTWHLRCGSTLPSLISRV